MINRNVEGLITITKILDGIKIMIKKGDEDLAVAELSLEEAENLIAGLQKILYDIEDEVIH